MSEVGWGTYTASGTTLSRNVYKSTSSNALINCDGSQEVYITALGGDGGDLLHGSSNPMLGFDMPLNLQLNASVASNLLTISVKGNNGNDPSNTNPVLVPFRDSTIANGDPVWVAITSALSISTNAAGATLGSANTAPFRLWVVLFNNGGTPVLALWQSVTGGAAPTAIAALNEAALASTTGISASATAAGTFYTPNGTSLTSKPFRILGYVDYASGLTTAGTYASAPTTTQLYGPGIKKPGDIVQFAYNSTTTQPGSVTSSSFTTVLSVSISPSSAPNIVRVQTSSSIGASASLNAGSLAIARGTATPFCSSEVRNASSGTFYTPASVEGIDAPGTTSSTTYNVRIRSDGTSNVVIYPACASSPDNGTVTATEIMV